MSKKIERLTKELTAAEAEAERTGKAAGTAREEMIRALADGEGVEASRKREAAARAAAEDAKATVSALREALARVKREEEEAARAADVAELTAYARRFTREAEEYLRTGAAKVAEGLLAVGRAMLAAADAEAADSALDSLKAAHAGRGRLYGTEIEETLKAAILASYPRPDGGIPWSEDVRLTIVPHRCAPIEKT